MRRLALVLGLVIAGCSSPPAEESFNTDEAETTEALTAFSTFQEHNLHVVNTYRARKHLTPLTLGPKISTFAI